MMKKTNFPLLIGSIILLVLLFVMLFPQFLTDKSPYTIQQLRFLSVDGNFDVEKAPFPPSPEFLLGTDDLGRDIWSYIVFGMRTTISLGLLTALCQLLVALPIALLGGTNHKSFKNATQLSNTFFSAIPALLICILVLQIDFFTSLNRNQSFLVFICVLTIAGWSKLGVLLIERIEWLYQQSFITGAIAIGKRKWRIALENLLPHLIPEVVVLYFMEVARNLSLMMQLGLFGVFIGNLRLVLDSQNGNLTFFNISYEPEWASMLSTSRTYLTLAPWTVIFPALAFFISVLGFNLFGEGLRTAIGNRNSMLIPAIRYTLTLNFRGLKNIQTKTSQRYIAMTLAILLFFSTLNFVVGQPTQFKTISENNLSLLDAQGVIGTNASLTAAKQIENAMKSLGLVPVEENSFITSYPIEQGYLIEDQSMFIDNTPLVPHSDFAYYYAPSSKTGSENPQLSISALEGLVIDATTADLISMTDFSAFEDCFILIDPSYYNPEFIDSWIRILQTKANVKGVLMTTPAGESLDYPILQTSEGLPVIRISSNVAKMLISNGSALLRTNASAKRLNPIGHNVIGIYSGSDTSLKDEYIAIGLSYNYTNPKDQSALQFNMDLIQQLCALNKNKRSLLFIFTDGTLVDSFHGIHPFSKDVPFSTHKIKVFIDLTNLSRSQTMRFSKKQAPITRQFAWHMGQMIDDALTRERVPNENIPSTKVGVDYWFTESSALNAMFWEAGIASLVIQDNGQHLETIGKILLEVIEKNNY